MAYAVLAVTIGVVLQWLVVGDPATDIDYAAPMLTPATAGRPGGVPSAPPGPIMVVAVEATPTMPAGPAPTLAPPVNVERVSASAVERANAEGGVFAREEVEAVLRAAGWAEEAIPGAVSVAWCESRWSPGASNGGNEGLFQVNVTSRATLRGSWFAYFGVPEDWYNPVLNATVARWIWERSGGWGPWSCKA